MLLEKRYEEIDVLTDIFHDYFDVFQNQLGYIHNFIHAAAARSILYGTEVGMKDLQKALDIACQDNIIMPFVENAEFVLPMLKYNKNGGHAELIRKITEICDEKYNNHKSSFGLSPREEEILLMFENGFSQKEIAEQLFISPNTVKRHVQNIYHKMDVNNKTLAIRKYHELKHDRI